MAAVETGFARLARLRKASKADPVAAQELDAVMDQVEEYAGNPCWNSLSELRDNDQDFLKAVQKQLKRLQDGLCSALLCSALCLPFLLTCACVLCFSPIQTRMI